MYEAEEITERRDFDSIIHYLLDTANNAIVEPANFNKDSTMVLDCYGNPGIEVQGFPGVLWFHKNLEDRKLILGGNYGAY